jgi:Carboxypeptidase regulatory-like domain
MIGDIDQRLVTWIRTVLDSVDVSLALPGPGGAAKQVSLYLMELAPQPAARSNRRPPLQMMLRYLVLPQADDPIEAHRMLGELIVSALESSDFEVEQDALSPTTWLSLGLAPRPAFVLRVPFRWERPEKLAPRVTQPLIIKQTSFASIHGQIVGPNAIPIADARVELPALERATTTDYLGRFQFSSVPAEPSEKQLRVRAKGKEFTVTTSQADVGEPLVIHLELEG